MTQKGPGAEVGRKPQPHDAQNIRSFAEKFAYKYSLFFFFWANTHVNILTLLKSQQIVRTDLSFSN